MGFDPHRPHRASPFDYVFVVAAVLAGIALLVWAIWA